MPPFVGYACGHICLPPKHWRDVDAKGLTIGVEFVQDKQTCNPCFQTAQLCESVDA